MNNGQVSVKTQITSNEKLLGNFKRLYRDSILPLEKAAQFELFHSAPLLEVELDSKPLVAFIGENNVGKTSLIERIIKRRYPPFQEQPLCSTDKFYALYGSDSDAIIPGELVIQHPLFPFASLSQAVPAVAPYLTVCAIATPLLSDIALIDTPPLPSSVALASAAETQQEIARLSEQCEKEKTNMAQQQRQLQGNTNSATDNSQYNTHNTQANSQTNTQTNTQNSAFVFNPQQLQRMHSSIARMQQQIATLTQRLPQCPYDLSAALEWLLSHADLVVFVFDACCVGASPATERVLQQALHRGTAEKLRVVLSKCECVSPAQLDQAYAQLSYLLGHCAAQGVSLPRIFCCAAQKEITKTTDKSMHTRSITLPAYASPRSLTLGTNNTKNAGNTTNNRPNTKNTTNTGSSAKESTEWLHLSDSPEASLRVSERAADDFACLVQELARLPRTAVELRVTNMLKRAKLLRAVAAVECYMRDEMPLIGRDSKKKEILSDLSTHYNTVSQQRIVPLRDFPPASALSQRLQPLDPMGFKKFSEIKPIFDLCTGAVNRELPFILQQIQASPAEQSAALLSSLPHTHPWELTDSSWQQYKSLFSSLVMHHNSAQNSKENALLSGVSRSTLERTLQMRGITASDVQSVLNLCVWHHAHPLPFDPSFLSSSSITDTITHPDDTLFLAEFIVAMHLTHRTQEDGSVPSSVSPQFRRSVHRRVAAELSDVLIQHSAPQSFIKHSLSLSNTSGTSSTAFDANKTPASAPPSYKAPSPFTSATSSQTNFTKQGNTDYPSNSSSAFTPSTLASNASRSSPLIAPPARVAPAPPTRNTPSSDAEHTRSVSLSQYQNSASLSTNTHSTDRNSSPSLEKQDFLNRNYSPTPQPSKSNTPISLPLSSSNDTSSDNDLFISSSTASNNQVQLNSLPNPPTSQNSSTANQNGIDLLSLFSTSTTSAAQSSSGNTNISSSVAPSSGSTFDWNSLKKSNH